MVLDGGIKSFRVANQTGFESGLIMSRRIGTEMLINIFTILSFIMKFNQFSIFSDEYFNLNSIFV